MANENDGVVPVPTTTTPNSVDKISAAFYPDATKPVVTPPANETVAKAADPVKPDTVPTGAPAPEKKTEEAPASGDKPVVPEKYELKLPEGSLLDAKQIEAVSAFAKAKGLTNDQAQDVLNREAGAVKSFSEMQKQQHETQVAKWHDDVKADKELGGEAFAQSALYAKNAAEKYASPEFRKVLDETGYGNHPELVRFFARVGKAMSPDVVVRSGAQATGKKTPAEIMYPEKGTN